jgi:hypothetical protein
MSRQESGAQDLTMLRFHGTATSSGPLPELHDDLRFQLPNDQLCHRRLSDINDSIVEALGSARISGSRSTRCAPMAQGNRSASRTRA